MTLGEMPKVGVQLYIPADTLTEIDKTWKELGYNSRNEMLNDWAEQKLKERAEQR